MDIYRLSKMFGRMEKNLALYFMLLGYLSGSLLPAQAVPRFLTRVERPVEVKEHQSVRLGCAIENINEDVAIMWRRDNVEQTIIYINEDPMSSDDRYRLDHNGNNYTLIIDNVAPYDSGDYLCVITMEPQITLRQTLQVHVPPSVSMVPESSPLIIKPKEALQLTCYGNGNPPPEIVWRRTDSKNLPGGHGSSYKGQSLSYPIADESMEGVYECSADNGVGQPARKQIAVVVHSGDPEELVKPKVEIPQDLYIVQPDQSVNITCQYLAKPAPQVDWSFGGYPLQKNSSKYQEFRAVEANGWVSTLLLIQNIQPTDLGDYTCRVHNNMGGKERSILVTSIPGPVQVEPVESADYSVGLRWTVDSPSKVTKYKVEYRLLGGESWQVKELDPPHGDDLHDGKFHMTYILEGLVPGTEYEIRVSAKNAHGWGSLPESPVVIKTSGSSVVPTPAASSLEDTSTPGGASIMTSSFSCVAGSLLLVGLLSLYPSLSALSNGLVNIMVLAL